MATESQNIYLTKREKLKCKKCNTSIPLGKAFVGETEKSRGTCFACSDFVDYTLLPPGNAAMTRRSKKHSDKCGVLLTWNQRRKRYERKGQYVEAAAIEKAKIECAADQKVRDQKNEKAAITREKQDKIYINDFAIAIREVYHSCPKGREFKIAEHACEKHSGRVGRTANAKKFDKQMIDLAVEAHIRHMETNYDTQFGKGKGKKEIRSDIKFDVKRIMMQWRQLPTLDLFE
ncbi:DUF2293 domain-containing protein [Putridiphycobacter roseus]|uniref:DUF2293 domain-containing protein n=1 Tax=Putridiphycobacter roseus TaxID=2219161 RepID=A0A2W1N3E8_9FLAO|nr:DUF2293 domain-containing protein [Putridiphycobacter roseus]PZE17551.1 DUF2293 domain-containing protein [Putridiphycobacter roseus]